jgi:hypothetical protein
MNGGLMNVQVVSFTPDHFPPQHTFDKQAMDQFEYDILALEQLMLEPYFWYDFYQQL